MRPSYAPIVSALAILLVTISTSAAHATQAPEPPASGGAGPSTLDGAKDLIQSGRYAEAEAAARSVLAETEAAHGAESLAAADALAVLVDALVNGGKTKDPETLRLAERAVAIREEALGAEHPDVASSVNSVALVLHDTGNLPAAKAAYERALAIREKALGPDDSSVATSLNNLAILHQDMGDFAASRPLLERTLAIKERALGPEHSSVANTLASLGAVLERAGDSKAALPYFERALAINEKALGPEHPHVAAMLSNLGLVLANAGRPADARPFQERALAIQEKALGPDHPHVATSLANVGLLLRDLGDHARAMQLLERSLAIREKAFGAEHPTVAMGLQNLGGILLERGDYAAARPLFERAAAIIEKAFGPDDARLGIAFDNLGGLLLYSGDVDAARRILERGLAVREKALGPAHPAVAASLLNVAGALQKSGDPGAARSAYERALAIREKALGPEHPLVATTLANLGTLLQETGDLKVARAHHERALAIREKTFGSETPEVAACLNNLGGVRLAEGDAAGARELFARALAMREAAFGGAHPDVAKSLNNLAWARAVTGDLAAASRDALRAEDIGRAHARLTFRTLSERQALRLAAVRTRGLDVALSVALQEGSLGAAECFDAAIRSRAFVLDEMMARRRAPTDEANRSLADDVRSARERLANLTIRGPGRQAQADYRKLLDEALLEKERAERALAERSVTFREEVARANVGLDEVASRLGPGEALVAYLRFGRHGIGTPTAPPFAAASSSRSVPSYAAFVLRAGAREPALVALGAANEIERLVARWRASVTSPEAGDSERDAGRALRAAVWDPVAPWLGEAQRIFVVPDGALHLVSLAALPRGDDTYLVEGGQTFHGLTAERDLVPGAGERGESDGLFVAGDPAFDEETLFAALAPRPAPPPTPSPVAQVASLALFRGQRASCGGFASLRFEPLPGAGREAEDVAARWREHATGRVVHLVSAAASETAFKLQAPRARVLHLATHGFFLGGSCEAGEGATRGMTASGATRDEPPAAAGESPLLLSGLAFAGANKRDAAAPDEDDGIVTAEEVASLDLSGVDWVVLSACDTGLGDITAGEGVFGLRRAFQVAGARSVITSLWAVDDDATRRWMSALYDARLARRLDTAACAREASLAVLREQRERGLPTSPLTWGAFVATGEWR